MDFKVSKDAAKWYKKELSITSSAYIRFFPRYGYGGHIPGFSIGINHDTPKNIHTSIEVENIIFFIETEDAWYFDGIHLHVNINDTLQEPEFTTK